MTFINASELSTQKGKPGTVEYTRSKRLEALQQELKDTRVSFDTDQNKNGQIDGGDSFTGDGIRYYAINSGDTPASVAQKLGVDVETLAKTNNLKKDKNGNYVIKTGNFLKATKPGQEEASTATQKGKETSTETEETQSNELSRSEIMEKMDKLNYTLYRCKIDWENGVYKDYSDQELQEALTQLQEYKTSLDNSPKTWWEKLGL